MKRKVPRRIKFKQHVALTAVVTSGNQQLSFLVAVQLQNVPTSENAQ